MRCRIVRATDSAITLTICKTF